MQLHIIPIGDTGQSFLLLLTGSISVVNGIALIFNDRKLNKFLTSSLLINSGLMLIFDALIMMGYSKFNGFKTSTLVPQIFIGILSTFLVWGHYYERKQKFDERDRDKEKTSSSNSNGR